jgi:urease alpha subunit
MFKSLNKTKPETILKGGMIAYAQMGDPKSFRVSVDGEPIVTQPAKKLPLMQLYNLF